MNEQPDKNKEIQPYDDRPRPRFRNNQIWTGLFILIIGAIFLMRQTGVDFPYWFFTWPVLLIGIGILGAIKNNFHPGGWMAVLIIGAVFLADRLMPGTPIQQYAWPLLIMAVGIWIIVRPKTQRPGMGHCRERRWGGGAGIKMQPWNPNLIATILLLFPMIVMSL